MQTERIERKYEPRYLIVYRGIVPNDRGQILVLQRSLGHHYYPGKWELPGGIYNAEDKNKSSLERIVHRETGLVVVQNTHLSVYPQTRYVTEGGKYHGYNYLEITYPCLALGPTGHVRIDQDNHSGSRWLGLEEVFREDLTLESQRALGAYYRELSLQEQLSFPIKVVGRVLISNNEGKYLFLKRGENVRYPGFWEIPGGKLNKLEFLTELFRREALEESGLLVRIDRPIGHFSSLLDTSEGSRGDNYIQIITVGHLVAGIPVLSPEHSETAWFDREEVVLLKTSPYLQLPIMELLYSR